MAGKMKFSGKKNKDFTLYIEKILFTLFFMSLLPVLLSPVQDPDVFWHLKTGEWIWQHKALPDKDPFSFTVDASIYEESARPYVIVKGYWLSQLIIYGLHRLFGIYGIIVFRCLIYLGLIFLLYFWMRRKGIGQIITLLFLLPTFLMVYMYQGERPNTLSYLMAVIVLYILDEYIYAGKRKSLLLPVFMLLWSAMHGGFLLGEVLIGIYLIVMVYRSLKQGDSFKTYGFKIITLLVAMALPFLNNGWQIIMTMLELSGSLYYKQISEWMNPFILAAMGNYGFLAVLVFMILLIIVVIRRFSLEHMLIAIFLLSISFTAIRYIPFLVILMTPIVSFHWATRPTFNANNKLFRYSIYAAILFSIIFVGQRGFRELIVSNGPIYYCYPEDAVKFIKTVKPEGRMFNYFDWGGYLIYSLYPDKKVFIDGRGLSLQLFEEYGKIITGSQKVFYGAMPEWKTMLDKYSIEMMLIPANNLFDARFNLIIKRLVDDPEWSLIFIGNKSPALLFLKNIPSNAELIKRYSMRKEFAYEKAMENLMYKTGKRGPWRNDLQIGLLNIFLSRYADSRRYFEKALEKNSSLAKTSVFKVVRDIKNNGHTSLNDKEIYEIYSY